MLTKENSISLTCKFLRGGGRHHCLWSTWNLGQWALKKSCKCSKNCYSLRFWAIIKKRLSQVEYVLFEKVGDLVLLRIYPLKNNQFPETSEFARSSALRDSAAVCAPWTRERWQWEGWSRVGWKSSRNNLLHYCELKTILHSDFRSFYLLSIFCPRTRSRMLHHFCLSGLLRLRLAMAVTQASFVWDNLDRLEAFCSGVLNRSLVLLMIRLELRDLGRKPQRCSVIFIRSYLRCPLPFKIYPSL